MKLMLNLILRQHVRSATWRGRDFLCGIQRGDFLSGGGEMRLVLRSRINRFGFGLGMIAFGSWCGIFRRGEEGLFSMWGRNSFVAKKFME